MCVTECWTYSLEESLSLVESTEVERVSPSVLVELSSTIVVACISVTALVTREDETYR